MNILILDRHTFGEEATEPWRFRLSEEGHNVDYSSGLLSEGNSLSNYNVVIAHPSKQDLPFLYAEANKRKNFKLIFFNAETLEEVNPDEQFPNRNVFFRGFPIPSELVKLVQSND